MFEWVFALQLMCNCSCEYYSTRLGGAWDHLFTYDVGNSLYDTDYLEALFDEDVDAIKHNKSAAEKNGYGPLVSCSTIANYGSMKVNCCMLCHCSCNFLHYNSCFVQLVNIMMITRSLFLQKWFILTVILHLGALNHSKNIGMYAPKYLSFVVVNTDTQFCFHPKLLHQSVTKYLICYGALIKTYQTSHCIVSSNTLSHMHIFRNNSHLSITQLSLIFTYHLQIMNISTNT